MNINPTRFNLSRTTYAKVAGKYQDVLTLEQSVAELHQMFLDFALLTEQQGELLDQIEFRFVRLLFPRRVVSCLLASTLSLRDDSF